MSMTTRAVRIAIAVLLLAPLGFVQVGHAQQPGPDIKKLDYFVGKWRLEIDIKATATTQAVKGSGTDDCELFANMHVVCKADAGVYRAMRTISYIPALKQYSSYTVDSYGYAVLTLGQVQGSTWTFASDVGGVKSRYVMKTSGNNYTATYEYAGADGKWTTSSETKATRMK